MPDPTVANEALLESWLLSLHDKAPRTRQLYQAEARRFASWLAEHHRPKATPGDLSAVSRADVEAWFTAQRDDGRAAATIRSRWIALRNLYGWATDEEELDANPMARVKVAKPEPPPVDVRHRRPTPGTPRRVQGDRLSGPTRHRHRSSAHRHRAPRVQALSTSGWATWTW